MGENLARLAAARISEQLEDGVELGGTLRVFGDWFGRPWDNYHRVVSADVAATELPAGRGAATAECLVVRFDGAEVLSVTQPQGVTFLDRGLRIEEAEVVVWQWLSYGRAHTPENLHRITHRVVGGSVKATTTTWPGRSHLHPSLGHPAVELLNWPSRPDEESDAAR